MKLLLQWSRWIDTVNDGIGRVIYWLVLAAVLISAANAVARKAFAFSSNAFLELQWLLFSAIFLLGGGYVLLKQEHVRIDIIYGKFTKRTQTWIDIFGTLFFLLPLAILVLWMSWPVFVRAYVTNEQSQNPGGLALWPARLLVPVGFALLIAQALSELIKRFAFLRGLISDPSNAQRPSKTAEEELAEAIQARGGGVQP